MIEANAAPRNEPLPTAGLVYVPDADPGSMQAARPGTIVRNPDDRPPFIVVDRIIETIVVARWPGRLWRVEVAETAVEQVIGSGYTRAIAVGVIEELPSWQLFGPRGRLVASIIDAVGVLDVADVALLGDSAGPDAERAYSAAWSRWESGTRVDGDASVGGVEGNPFRRRNRRCVSPIGYGFDVLCSAMDAKARELVGNEAFKIEEDGTPAFTAFWSAGCSALLFAAMAEGAPDLCSTDDRTSLMAAWRRLAGSGADGRS